MIGGQDLVIPCSDSKVALALATRAVILRWPDCFIEDADTGEELPDYAHMEFGELKEILVSKTPEASMLWDQMGACEATNGTLIHLLAGRTTLTVIVDDEPTKEMSSLVREIRRALMQDLFASRAMQGVE